MDSHQQTKSTQYLHSILSEIELAVEATQCPKEIDKLLWARRLLREYLSKGYCFVQTE